MKHILFVDDERNILSPLEHMLHRMRSTWDMDFACGAREAFELIDAGKEYEIVVSDLQMPGMDGTEFLRRISERFPEAIRIVLSGNLNSETLNPAAKVSHQVLAKPCDPDHLRNILLRACTLRERMEGSKIKTVLMRMGTLPSVPVLYWQIMNEVNLPNPSIERVAQLISLDPGMSAKVLKLANTHSGPKSTHISNIMYAAHTLGIENLKTLSLSPIFSIVWSGTIFRKDSKSTCCGSTGSPWGNTHD